MRRLKHFACKIDFRRILKYPVQLHLAITIPVLLPVLLFSTNVSSSTVPPHQTHELTLNTQQLQAIHALEQKAEQEIHTIQTLNKRIVQLEQKIAAINSTILAHQEFEADKTIQIVVNANEPETTSPATVNQPDHIFVGSATTHIDDTITDRLFNIEDTWNDIVSPNHTFSALDGLLITLIVLVAWRTYNARDTQSVTTSEEATTDIDANVPNPITSNEKNALIAQKLAALRSAVEKGKQRQQQND